MLPFVLFVGIVAGACSSSDSSTEPATTVLTEPQPLTSDTTGYSDDPCFKFPVDVLRLQNDYFQAVRGIVGADPAVYRDRAQAILDEARSRGCPDPKGLNMFLR